MREAARQREQVLRRRAGERVDRLVVVADCAELVARAEPAVEERLLEQVHVLVLVDREGAVALAEGAERPVVLVVEVDREGQEVLEVDEAVGRLPPLVLPEDPGHQVGRDRRVVVVQCGPVGLRREPAVLGPLHLGREVARRPEAVRAG